MDAPQIHMMGSALMEWIWRKPSPARRKSLGGKGCGRWSPMLKTETFSIFPNTVISDSASFWLTSEMFLILDLSQNPLGKNLNKSSTLFRLLRFN